MNQEAIWQDGQGNTGQRICDEILYMLHFCEIRVHASEGEPIDGSTEFYSLYRVGLRAVGRGGQGDMGQRIRDEILVVQSRNDCAGGMMEQWHQKLHNNTSPDDVDICIALIAYIDSGLKISAYWESLTAAGIDAARLKSFDRSITHEPSFRQSQCPQLKRDLQAYLVTLQAVHGGRDLQSAAMPVLGYTQVPPRVVVFPSKLRVK